MTDEKTGYKILEYLGVFVVLLCVLFFGFGDDSSELNRLQNDTDNTMGTIKTNAAIVGVEIGRTQESNRKLEEALNRTRAEIERSRASSNSIQASINELERIIGEAEELARTNANIINQVDGTTR
jgi:septal ring factor EnvC (AmiA/AmiB activator)